jgi:hypothetical protein
MSPAASNTAVPPGGSTDVTVKALVPLLPSLVAVIVAKPAATPLTNPELLTVATAAALVVQVTVLPVSVVPFASFNVVVNCTVAPTCTDDGFGVTVTEATGTVVALTVMVAVPLALPAAAVIVAVPAAMPVPSPVDETVATEPFELVQVKELIFLGLAVAVSWTVRPASMVALDGWTETALATNAGSPGPPARVRSGELAMSLQPSATHAMNVVWQSLANIVTSRGGPRPTQWLGGS